MILWHAVHDSTLGKDLPAGGGACAFWSSWLLLGLGLLGQWSRWKTIKRLALEMMPPWVCVVRYALRKVMPSEVIMSHARHSTPHTEDLTTGGEVCAF